MNKKENILVILLLLLLFLCEANSSQYLAEQTAEERLKHFAVKPLKYSFSYGVGFFGGYDSVTIYDMKQYFYPDFMINRIDYYADGILVKKLTREDVKKLGNEKRYPFKLANPANKTKLQPVKHKWEIHSTHGILNEERTLYTFTEEDGKFFFTEGAKENTTLSRTNFSRFKFREAPNKQPPVVQANPSHLGGGKRPYEVWTLRGVDNGNITKTEFYTDGKLITTYKGELPHRFEIINPEKKPIGTELMLLFKVYDNDGNITEVPAKGLVKKDTRTEFHGEKWMYLR